MTIGMGKKYFINNLEKGNYEIEFTAKEYEYGVSKEEDILYKSTIEHNGNNNKLKIGASNRNNLENNLKIIVNNE